MVTVSFKKFLRAFSLLTAFALAATQLSAQEEQKFFGQNKVQYQDFNWRFIQSEHFDIYFYQGGERVAKFVADVAEKALPSILADFKHYELQNRVPFIIYNSHNHFQQTNVVDEYNSEGIGGVTEIFKNRITLPYEGSYEDFRHVIEHELVHGVMNDYMYGGSFQAYLTGRIRVQIPHWFAEGLAEYGSRKDQFYAQSDMFIRDAVTEGYLPMIEQMGGFASYMVGPSIFKFMEEKYGKEKVAEFVTKMRAAGTAPGSFESTFGMKIDEFSEKWAMYQRKIYYPDIANMVSVKEIGKQLTRHDRDGNFYNYTPTLSPLGDKIAFLTDKSGYADIDLISSIDGKFIKKLISGEKNPSLEELHWLSPGMGWSPDGKRLVFSAKASDKDALTILEIETGKISSYKWDDLEGVFGGSWSPDGKRIVFNGIYHGQSDIYVFDLEKKEKIKLTDDFFSDTRAVFSRDGTKIAFVSDRRDFMGKPPEDFKMSEFDYRQTDIYVMNSDGSGMERVTTDEMNDTWPEWGPDNTKLLFTSDRNGVSNLYVADLENKKNYAITNTLSGIFQPSLSKDGKIVAFTGFNKSGFDIFTLKNPFEIPAIELPITISMKKFRKDNDLPQTLSDELGLGKSKAIKKGAEEVTSVFFGGDSTSYVDSAGVKITQQDVSYRSYVFAGNEGISKDSEDYAPVELPEKIYKDDSGDYKVRKYRIKFSPDLVFGTAGFNTFYGFQGTTQLAFSDMLGDHRLIFGTNLFFDLKNSSFSGAYYNFSRRTDYGISAFHTAYSFATDYVNEFVDPPDPNSSDGYADSFIRYRYYGASLFASRPINKFNRFDLGVTQFTLARETSVANDLGIDKKDIPGLGATRHSNNTIITAAFTTDNSLNTYFGPFDGQRAQLSVTASPGYGANGLRFTTIALDLRKYFWFQKYYAFALRASGGATYGRNPQRFFVGGLDNWIAPRFTNGDIIVNTFEDFLATFVSPVRGSDYYELQGTRYVVTNFEFRFPFVHFLQLGFPLPLFLQQIRGVTFLDVGAAWGSSYGYRDRFGEIQENAKKFNWYTPKLADGTKYFQDIRAGYGFGLRAFVGFFILRYDLAWNINSPRFNAGDVKHYFSIGSDF